MNTKHLLYAFVMLSFVGLPSLGQRGVAYGEQMQGSIFFTSWQGQQGTYNGTNFANSTTMTFAPGMLAANNANAQSGDFSSLLFQDDYPLTASLLTGLPGNVPLNGTLVGFPDSINDLLSFGGGNGTQYQFNLNNLTETYQMTYQAWDYSVGIPVNPYIPQSGTYTLTAYGTLVDTSGFYDRTPAEFVINAHDNLNGIIPGGDNSFTLTTTVVPEASSILLTAFGIVGFAYPFVQRRLGTIK